VRLGQWTPLACVETGKRDTPTMPQLLLSFLLSTQLVIHFGIFQFTQLSSITHPNHPMKMLTLLKLE